MTWLDEALMCADNLSDHCPVIMRFQPTKDQMGSTPLAARVRQEPNECRRQNRKIRARRCRLRDGKRSDLAERLPSRSPTRRATRKAEVSVRKNRKSPNS